MNFRVAARTLLHLGAELISTDEVAFFELVKNAFDAGSPRADIDVVVRLEYDACITQRQFILDCKTDLLYGEALEKAMDDCKGAIIAGVDYSTPHAGSYAGRIRAASSWDDLLELIDDANYILIEDKGSGMSLKDLEEVYLTVGTRYRLDERERQVESRNDLSVKSRPILGEKGIGRLSAMRLGWGLKVETTQAGETHWNILEVNWRNFDSPNLKFVGDVEVTSTRGNVKTQLECSGTRIRITSLASAWSTEKLQDIATELSKFTNPFYPRSRYQISLRFNREPIRIRRLDRILFEQAHAVVQATYSLDKDGPRFSGAVNYLLRNRQKTFSYDWQELFSITNRIPLSVLRALGPFSVEFYWYNRRALQAVEGIGTKRQVQEFVNSWSGGLMLFRDGFRVFPYGNRDDDWLDLDRKALASSGYKVNRKQIIGQVKIGIFDNPHLVDQTNREGLRDCPEKDALVQLLKHLLEGVFRTFINLVDKEIRALEPVSFDDLEERAEDEIRQMRHYIEALLNKYPQLKHDLQIVRPLEQSVARIRLLLDEASQLAEAYDVGRTQLLNLAGLGMMVEIVAHELNRATRFVLRALAAPRKEEPDNARGTGQFDVLEAQLRTLQKRLRILDPLSTAGRQHKQKFDLIGWVDEILQSHQAQFDRHDIQCVLRVLPEASPEKMEVRMVKGMVVHIVENILSNSVYWIKEQKVLDKSFEPKIEVDIDTRAKEIRFTDNGPGVDPLREEEIFQPFVTTKAPGEGKGLGLYISREIASYHDAAFGISEERTVHPDRLNTFVFSLESNER